MTAQSNYSRRLVWVLGALAMFGPFSIDTVFPAFLVMGKDLAVSQTAIQQTISVYLFSYAAMSLFHGAISDAIGRRPVILFGTLLFTFASIGCALSESLSMMLFFRALQGFSAGVGLIVGRAIIRDVLDGDAAQRLMSQVSMIFGIAPAVAPIIGGWILGWSSWPMIFWFLAAFGVVLFSVTWIVLPESHLPPQRAPLDFSTLITTYLQMLGDPQFRRLALVGSFNFGALFLYISSAPAYVMQLLQLNEQQFAYFFVPTISGMILGAFVSGRYAGKITIIRFANIGFAICWLSVALNFFYSFAVDRPTLPLAVLPMAISAFGIAIVFPIVTLKLLDMFPQRRGSVSSMQSFISLTSHSLVAGLLSPLLSHSHQLLAIGSACFTAIAYLLWRWYLRKQAGI